MEQVTYLKKGTPILSILETFEFTKKLDLALRAVDFEKLKDVFVKVNLLNHPEAKDFLIQGEDMLKKYNNPDKGIKVLNVSKRKSKCIACSFGKTVNVYDINYKKQSLLYSVSYTSSFAINLEIENGSLMDFGWCNAFLSNKEMKELTGI